jgi:hypothetical protein
MTMSIVAAPTTSLDPALAARIVREGYGPGAWHGANLQQMDLVLGITCHAVYHAGQIQLIKVLAAAA